jgi:quercetin dioxygenase-like cupin family protein
MMTITRRDVTVALIAGAVTLGVLALADEKPTPVGSVRSFFRAPTARLAELELHVTTLNPGETSHAPHTHANEELVIVKEGAVEVLGVRLGPGSVVFNASNERHGLRSVSCEPATYHVINWRPHEGARRVGVMMRKRVRPAVAPAWRERVS